MMSISGFDTNPVFSEKMLNQQRKDKYLPFKLSQLRFLTAKHIHNHALLAAGSWLEERNRISLWGYDFASEFTPIGKFRPYCDAELEQGALLGDSIDEPLLLSSLSHDGDVQSIRCLAESQHVFVAGSNGSIGVVGIKEETCPDSPDLDWLKMDWLTKAGWSPLVNSRVPISAMDVSEDGLEIYFATDDAQIISINTERIPRAHEISSFGLVLDQGIDTCAVTALERINSNSIATVNELGQLKLWDLRGSGLRFPESRIIRPGAPKPLLCIASHPGQPNLIAVGGIGTSVPVYMWDTRATKYPLTEMPCPGNHATCLQFHPTNPDVLYIGTQNAGLLKITSFQQISSNNVLQIGNATVWQQECHRMDSGSGGKCKLSVEPVHHEREIEYGRTIHTFDVTHSRIASCSDENSILQTIPCFLNEIT